MKSQGIYPVRAPAYPTAVAKTSEKIEASRQFTRGAIDAHKDSAPKVHSPSRREQRQAAQEMVQARAQQTRNFIVGLVQTYPEAQHTLNVEPNRVFMNLGQSPNPNQRS